ncbi:hypothetical protein ANCDUO_10112 [Ancylostoma duodenale]|uniref:Uncharacterized protein n=1 Tax=Ancylostoma duodenale TaxID=51022 RepID=A0A0C2GRP3_9BILA|nr:hypothetical protein ANCDUO_10112 [Ancylostoma duodenale]
MSDPNTNFHAGHAGYWAVSQRNLLSRFRSFNRSLDAYRNFFAGEYSCCIHESLGKACYAQQLQIRDPPQQIGLDLSGSDTLYAKVGNSYDIRLTDVKEHDEVQCSFNNHTVVSNVFPLNHKEKKGKHYQLRIRHFSEENVGSYECTLKLHDKVSPFFLFHFFLNSKYVIAWSGVFLTGAIHEEIHGNSGSGTCDVLNMQLADQIRTFDGLRSHSTIQHAVLPPGNRREFAGFRVRRDGLRKYAYRLLVTFIATGQEVLHIPGLWKMNTKRILNTTTSNRSTFKSINSNQTTF